METKSSTNFKINFNNNDEHLDYLVRKGKKTSNGLQALENLEKYCSCNSRLNEAATEIFNAHQKEANGPILKKYNEIMKNPCGVLAIPTEVRSIIADFLPEPSLPALMQVNKLWNQSVKTEKLLEKLDTYKQEYIISKPIGLEFLVNNKEAIDKFNRLGLRSGNYQVSFFIDSENKPYFDIKTINYSPTDREGTYRFLVEIKEDYEHDAFRCRVLPRNPLITQVSCVKDYRSKNISESEGNKIRYNLQKYLHEGDVIAIEDGFVITEDDDFVLI
jgi:hypothetical protein